jgi:hypothetical protein
MLPLPQVTLNRLASLQTLNKNDREMLEGINDMLRSQRFKFKNNNDMMRYRRNVIANQYIDNMYTSEMGRDCMNITRTNYTYQII